MPKPTTPPAPIPHSPRLTPHAAAGTVLAFDFGEKRVGVAVGDLTLRIAHPLSTIAADDNATRFKEIGAAIAEWRPVRLIVGLPMHADGTEHEVSRLARRFAQRLEGRFGIPTALVDERLTSRSAEEKLRASGARAGEIEESLDAAAAQEIPAGAFRKRGRALLRACNTNQGALQVPITSADKNQKPENIHGVGFICVHRRLSAAGGTLALFVTGSNS